MICNKCKQDKPITHFCKHKVIRYTKGVPHEDYCYQKLCRDCRNKRRWELGENVPWKEYQNARRYDWGYVCEVYVNNPNIPLEQIGRMFGLTLGQVSRIISEYLGDGKPIYMNIRADD